MKVFLVVAVCLIAANADTVLDKWNEFKLTHGKTYKSLLEEKRRLEIFRDNLKIIDQHNEKFEKGISTFEMGVTHFADMTEEEFISTLGYLNSSTLGMELKTFKPTGLSVDKNIDWIAKGCVTNVKQQGNCGSCWAFSTAAVVEGQVAKKTKVLQSLSAQNLLDCVVEGNSHCGGGEIAPTFRYIRENGILTEKEYPNVQYAQRTCMKRGGLKVGDITQVPVDPEAALEALATVGPLSMSFDATDLRFVVRGIIDGTGRCQSSLHRLNHAALIVGAGTEGGVDYFNIKNSWGPHWGPYNNGYFKIKRTENTCGCLFEIIYAELPK